MAASVNMTAKSFNRLCIRHCGKSFTRMLIGYRVAMGCRLLQETNLQVTEIATRCGFHNLANFNRQFLGQKAMPPSHYRRYYRMNDGCDTTNRSVDRRRATVRALQ